MGAVGNSITVHISTVQSQGNCPHPKAQGGTGEGAATRSWKKRTLEQEHLEKRNASIKGHRQPLQPHREGTK